MDPMNFSGATILLTGGTGSFGNAFTRRVLDEWPDAVVRVYSRDELKQHEMRERVGDDQVRFLIGDVRDRDRLYRAAQGADFIVHAAAMKQVPACEYNPFEAVQTNVIGAQNVVDVAIDAGVKRVVALSTDKAVNPVNLYGATKLCAEKIIVQGNAYAARTTTRLACVRYGNVAGSRGSVVPVFKTQIERDGRLTITDERMTRFWITLAQATDLVLHAFEHAEGGEVFVPKIPSMRVVDLAEAMAPGLPCDITGIRPGEKLHELLLTADESRHAVEHDDVFVVLPEHPWWDDALANGHGKPVADGFAYSSDTNEEWLTVEALAALLP
jgi:UDP-N-acetylglucosamine 4,6-dehydratase